MSLYSAAGESADAVVVVYDSASDKRKDNDNTVQADIFLLPQ
ncbi:hypothetical protein [Pseudomonas sp. LS1212]